MSHLLLSFERFISILEEHHGMDPSDFVLKYSGKKEWPVKDIAEQLRCYPKAEKKFPTLHSPGMIYTDQALQQATPEAVLNERSNMFSGDLAIDLTGGIGMDSFALSRSFKEVISLERSEALIEIASHNHTFLDAGNITHINADSEKWLREFDGTVDLIFIDPSRRTEGRRVFLLKDCEPDIHKMMPDILSKSRQFAIKLSPIYDIRALVNEIEHLHTITVVSSGGEVREILAVGEPGYAGKPIVKAIVLKNESRIELQDNENLQVPVTESISGYLFEPDAAVIKAGLSHVLAGDSGSLFLNHSTDYLITPDRDEHPGGVKFSIDDVHEYKPSQIKKYLADKNLTRVRIHRRDFPHAPEQLYKTLKLKMGDQADLFFTHDAAGSLIMIITRIN
jgi:hypothetical protein